jgi:hypothetical protein
MGEVIQDAFPSHSIIVLCRQDYKVNSLKDNDNITPSSLVFSVIIRKSRPRYSSGSRSNDVDD